MCVCLPLSHCWLLIMREIARLCCDVWHAGNVRPSYAAWETHVKAHALLCCSIQGHSLVTHKLPVGHSEDVMVAQTRNIKICHSSTARVLPQADKLVGMCVGKLHSLAR